MPPFSWSVVDSNAVVDGWDRRARAREWIRARSSPPPRTSREVTITLPSAGLDLGALGKQMSALRTAYPWLASGVISSLAQAAKGPRSPEALAAVSLSLPRLAKARGAIADGIGYEDGFIEAGLDKAELRRSQRQAIRATLDPLAVKAGWTPGEVMRVARDANVSPDRVVRRVNVDTAIGRAEYEALTPSQRAAYSEEIQGPETPGPAFFVEHSPRLLADVGTEAKFRYLPRPAEATGIARENLRSIGETLTTQDQSFLGAAVAGVKAPFDVASSAWSEVAGERSTLGAANRQAIGTIPAVGPSINEGLKGVQAGAKAATRGIGVGLMAGMEAVSAWERSAQFSPTRLLTGQTGRPSAFGTLIDPGEVVAQTTAGQALKAVIEGKEVDLGTGFLPDPASGVGRAQAAASKKALSVNGEAATYGRAFATFVGADPDSDTYNLLSGLVDAAAVIGVPGTPFKGLDPANYGLTALGAIGTSNRTLRNATVGDAGGVQGLRKMVLGETAEQFIDTNPRLAKVKEWITTTSSPSEIMREFPKDFPRQSIYGDNVFLELSRADTPEAVDDVLKKVLGITYRDQPKFAGFGYKMRRATTDVRMLGLVPEKTLDPADLDSFVEGVERHLLNAKVPVARRNEILDDIFRGAESDGVTIKVARYTAIKAVGDTITESMIRSGLPEAKARKFAQIFNKYSDDTQQVYGRAAANGELNIPGFVDADGNAVDFVQHPLTSAHGLSSKIEMPDPRDIRKATSSLQPLLLNDDFKMVEELVDSYMSKWRLGILLKPNLPLRVLGEETMRMSADGLASMASHPGKAITIALGGKPEHPWFTGLLTKGGRLTRDMVERMAAGKGANLDDYYTTARADAERRLTGVGESGEVISRAPEKEIVALTEKIYREKIANKVTAGLGSYVSDAAHHPFDPEAFDVGARNHLAEVQYDNWSAIVGSFNRLELDDWVRVAPTDERWSTGMVVELTQIRNAPEHRAVAQMGADSAKQWFWDGDGAFRRNALARQEHLAPMAGDTAAAKRAADAYIDTLAEQITDLTRGDPELLDAAATGVFRGERLVDRYNTPSAQAIGALDEFKATRPVEQLVKLKREINVGGLRGADKKLDNVLRNLFFSLMPRPSNWLNRSPAFRQYYWDQRAPDLAAYLRPEDWDEFLANAADAKISPETMSRLQRIRKTSTMTADNPLALNLEQLDWALKGQALSDTRGLLYHLSERQQISDMYRNVFPFLEAWKEVLGRWMSLVKEHPKILRTAQRDIAALRNSGVFHEDPVTKQEVFSIPATGWLTEKLIGVPIPLEASAAGLSLASSGLPGFGPVVQVPAQFLIPDDPDWDWLKSAIFPFGDFDSSGNPVWDVVAGAAPIPNWLRRTFNAVRDPDSYREQINTTGHIMQYLASTGEYDLNGPNAVAEMQRLVGDAKGKSMWFSFIRAAALATSPSAPMPRWDVQDKSGNTVLAWSVAQEYRKMLDASDGNADKALEKFIKKFGDDNLLTLQAFSEPVKGYLPPTKKALDWARRHPEAREAHADVYGFFAPGQDTDKEGFDIDAFGRSFDRDERKPIKPEDQVKAANSRIASYLYRQDVERATDSEEDQEWLRQRKEMYRDEYPGYDESGYDFREVPTIIRKIEDAVKDPSLRRTDAGRAAVEYLKHRRDALKVMDGATLSGKNDEELRGWLREWGETLVREHPEFESMWTYAFSRELDT